MDLPVGACIGRQRLAYPSASASRQRESASRSRLGPRFRAFSDSCRTARSPSKARGGSGRGVGCGSSGSRMTSARFAPARHRVGAPMGSDASTASASSRQASTCVTAAPNCSSTWGPRSVCRATSATSTTSGHCTSPAVAFCWYAPTVGTLTRVAGAKGAGAHGDRGRRRIAARWTSPGPRVPCLHSAVPTPAA